MNSSRLFLPLFAGVLAATPAPAQLASAFQGALSRLQPTHLWTFDRGYASAVPAPGAALSVLGGRFGPDLDAREAGAHVFIEASDGLVLTSDPVTGGGPAGNLDADGTGSIVFLFRTLDRAPRGQRFLFAQGAKGAATHNALGLFVQAGDAASTPGALVLRVGNAQAALVPAEELRPETWYFFALTWDEARRADQVSWTCGPADEPAPRSGRVNITQRAVIGNDGPFNIGFSEEVGSSAYREVAHPGHLDAFAIFDRELKPQEIQALHALLRRP